MTSLMVLLLSSTTWAAAWFTDGFESGDATHTENGAFWFAGGGTKRGVVTNARAKTGTYSMQFESSVPVWSEERFDLGANKTEVYIRYYIWFPTNYSHTNVSPSNNKLIRLWSDNANYTNDPVKMGASLFYDSTYKAKVQLEAEESGSNVLDCGGTMTDFYTWGDWKLTEADLGKWLLFEWHMKLDSGAGDGALELWVDGEKVIGRTGQSWVGAPCSPGYFRVGYLFGYANAEYAETTYFYVDDFTLSDTYTGTGDAPASTGSLRPGVSASGVTFR